MTAGLRAEGASGMDREKRIVRTSVVCIAVNLVLVAFKATVGFLTNSIAVILDAVNNLSDALSSIITIAGTKLSAKRPDKKHPYGYGRIEYLTSVIIAVIVLLAGVTSLRESAEKALHPEEASYTTVSLIIIAAAVVAKFLTGRYVKKVGEEIKSGALIASGSDAFFDSILSLATLVAAVAAMLWGWKLEGILGVAISVIIIKAGIGMLMETLDSIIGLRADTELTEQIKSTVCGFPEVRGAYDLTLHNYGPAEIIGSVHIEVPDDMTARQLHFLTRSIAAKVYAELGVVLTVGVYAASDSSQTLAAIRAKAETLCAEREEILQMHGFYGDETEKTVMFDLIVDFASDAGAVRDALCAELKAAYPDYRFDIVLDSDYSD